MSDGHINGNGFNDFGVNGDRSVCSMATEVRGAQASETKASPQALASLEEKYVEEKVLAVIDEICDVFKHPNADSLWIARVQGWDVIVNISAMFGDVEPKSVIGRKIVYVQIDSIMPPEKFENDGIWKYLRGHIWARR